MTSRELDKGLAEKKPICHLYKEDSLWLDKYASDLIAKKISSPLKEVDAISSLYDEP
ncbi:hypothetical protein [Prochlorococcus sp. MIT 1307]|uniref:hypothetical protein n=1 Tax=Prochlorococcus sp. MIT 1307 TaxID=3096219 RepID=UPI002A75CBC8|nr:hypothetical protein [Prochlorococcus sp. MIT 1307]